MGSLCPIALISSTTSLSISHHLVHAHHSLLAYLSHRLSTISLTLSYTPYLKHQRPLLHIHTNFYNILIPATSLPGTINIYH